MQGTDAAGNYLAARDAADRYEQARSDAQPGGYTMPASVRRDPVWGRVARAASGAGAPVQDWIDAQFDHCPGPAPYVRGLASDRARQNYLTWSRSRGVLEDAPRRRFDMEVLRARTLSAALGLSGLDEFLLDPASGFLGYTRCMLCSESAFGPVSDAFGSVCLEEIERTPALAENIPTSLRERLNSIRGLARDPA